MASSGRTAQFMKALTLMVWRVSGRLTSLRLVQCTKVNSCISSICVLERSTFLSRWQLSQACANHFSLVVHGCFLMLENNKPLQGLEYEDCPKAIRVPANESGILETKAFHSTARVRHACLDVGFCTVCPTVIGYAAFQGCYSLQVVEMPGCVELNAVRWRVSGTSLTEVVIQR